jgi:hypothetical protein
MSNTIRRTKYKEKDHMALELQREIERIELKEALDEPYDVPYDDDELFDNPYIHGDPFNRNEV